MKFLVIGSGYMGSAVAYDLAQAEGTEEIVLADSNENRAREVAQRIGKPRVHPARLDAEYYDDVLAMMAGHDVAISAVVYTHNFLLSKAAIEAGVSLCDLGGNNGIVEKQMGLHSKAEQVEVTIVPNCGLAPGMANIIAMHGAKSFDVVDKVHIRVGGLPQHPRPPLNYQLVFNPEGLINEYVEESQVIRAGKLARVEPLTELEEIEFPPPFNAMEAFHTSGGVSSLTKLLNGRVREMDYKTIRYKGHCEKFRTLLELGFASSEPFAVGGSIKTARELFSELLKKKLTFHDKDVVLMRISISGELDGNYRTCCWDMIDYYDEKNDITAMMRTTSYPTSIIAQMIARGQIRRKGVFLPEQIVDGSLFLEEVAKRDIIIQEYVKVP
ncbi:MAG: saccharopine dehydrogenase C-terminal domain-containing protein [Bacteroidota bacterium]